MSGLIFNGISKIMPRWPFLSGVTKLRYFPIRSHDFQESFDFIGHCLKVMTPDKRSPRHHFRYIWLNQVLSQNHYFAKFLIRYIDDDPESKNYLFRKKDIFWTRGS